MEKSQTYPPVQRTVWQASLIEKHLQLTLNTCLFLLSLCNFISQYLSLISYGFHCCSIAISKSCWRNEVGRFHPIRQPLSSESASCSTYVIFAIYAKVLFYLSAWTLAVPTLFVQKWNIAGSSLRETSSKADQGHGFINEPDTFRWCWCRICFGVRVSSSLAMQT